MTHARETPPGCAPIGRWDRFVEARVALASTWVDGRTRAIQMGTRRGSGTRRVERDGEISFTSIDGGDKWWEEADADSTKTGSGSREGLSRDDERLLEEQRAASEFLNGVREGFETRVGRTLCLRGEIQLYVQRVMHENEERRVTDLRRGLWIEITAGIPDHGTMAERLAGETVSELLGRNPAYELGRSLGVRCRRPRRRLFPLRGEYPVVFAAGGCEALLHEIGHQFEGRAVGAGKEWAVGREVASPLVSIVDDPARGVAGRGVYRRDDEGIPPTKVVLVERGRIADRIVSGDPFDERSAKRTGHARRASYRDLPLTRMACTILEPGHEDPRAIVAGTSKGILVRRIGSGSTDPESGRVTLSVTEAYLIDKGEIARPIAPAFLVSDVGSLLAGIDVVGSDLTFDHGATNCVMFDQHLPVIVGLPTIRIGMIKVISPYS